MISGNDELLNLIFNLLQGLLISLFSIPNPFIHCYCFTMFRVLFGWIKHVHWFFLLEGLGFGYSLDVGLYFEGNDIGALIYDEIWKKKNIFISVIHDHDAVKCYSNIRFFAKWLTKISPLFDVVLFHTRIKGRLWFRNSTIGQGHRRIRSYMFYIINESADGHFKIIFCWKKNFFFGASTRQRKANFLIISFTIPRVIFGH